MEAVDRVGSRRLIQSTGIGGADSLRIETIGEGFFTGPSAPLALHSLCETVSTVDKLTRHSEVLHRAADRFNTGAEVILTLMSVGDTINVSAALYQCFQAIWNWDRQAFVASIKRLANRTLFWMSDSTYAVSFAQNVGLIAKTSLTQMPFVGASADAIIYGGGAIVTAKDLYEQEATPDKAPDFEKVMMAKRWWKNMWDLGKNISGFGLAISFVLSLVISPWILLGFSLSYLINFIGGYVIDKEMKHLAASQGMKHFDQSVGSQI